MGLLAGALHGRLANSPPCPTTTPENENFKVHESYIDADAAMTRFRPCIDLHAGQVKQIVGGTLTTTSSDLKTNYVSKQPASHFAQLYRNNALAGAHVIMLGPGNEEAAKQALAAWPRSLQVGGGITDKNARQWIEWGADKVRDFSYNHVGYGILTPSLLNGHTLGTGRDYSSYAKVEQ